MNKNKDGDYYKGYPVVNGNNPGEEASRFLNRIEELGEEVIPNQPNTNYIVEGINPGRDLRGQLERRVP